MCETCNVGPGKFEGEGALTALAYWHYGNGGADITTDSDADGSVDWFRAPLNFDADQGALELARELGFCSKCITEALESDDGGGVAFWESDQGFAYLATFATRAEFDAALAEAESAPFTVED